MSPFGFVILLSKNLEYIIQNKFGRRELNTTRERPIEVESVELISQRKRKRQRLE